MKYNIKILPSRNVLKEDSYDGALVHWIWST